MLNLWVEVMEQAELSAEASFKLLTTVHIKTSCGHATGNTRCMLGYTSTLCNSEEKWLLNTFKLPPSVSQWSQHDVAERRLPLTAEQQNKASRLRVDSPSPGGKHFPPTCSQSAEEKLSLLVYFWRGSVPQEGHRPTLHVNTRKLGFSRNSSEHRVCCFPAAVCPITGLFVGSCRLQRKLWLQVILV